MTRRPLLRLVAAAALLASGPVVLLAAPDEVPAEVKKARKDLKKNATRLTKIALQLDELVAAARRIDGLKEPDKKKKQEAQADDVRTLGLETVSAVVAADNEDAAEFLLAWTVGVKDQQLFERGRDGLGNLGDEGAKKHILDVLVGDLGEDGKKKKKGKEDPQTAANKRALAAEVCEGLGGEAVCAALAVVIEKEPNAVLVNAAVKAASIGKEDKRLVTALVGLLGRVEKAGGWEYYRVREALMKLTGEDFLTHERWSEWWKGNEAAFDFSRKGSKTELGTRERAKEEKPPLFFGSEIESNRLCFVIDTSGSMEMTDRPAEHALTPEQFEKADPDTPDIKQYRRIERAKRALVECIKLLMPTQKFNVVRYSGGVESWQPKVVEATEQNKAAAVKWVEGFRADGGTHTDDALKRAFQDPEVDTIYLLSDGAPMKKVGDPAPTDKWPKLPDGRHDPNQPVAGDTQVKFAEEMIAEILDFVRLENRFRKVKIYTFGMDGPGVWHKKWEQPRPVSLPTDSRWLNCLSTFMRNLAGLTGGDFKSI